MTGMDKTDSMHKRSRRGEGVAAVAREAGASGDTAYRHARADGPSPLPPKTRRGPPKVGRWAATVGQRLTGGLGESGRQGHAARRVWAGLVGECGAEASGRAARRCARDARPRIC